jgi:hypothetical protein
MIREDYGNGEKKNYCAPVAVPCSRAFSQYLTGEIQHLALEIGRPKLNSFSCRLQSFIKDFVIPHLT